MVEIKKKKKNLVRLPQVRASTAGGVRTLVYIHVCVPALDRWTDGITGSDGTALVILYSLSFSISPLPSWPSFDQIDAVRHQRDPHNNSNKQVPQKTFSETDQLIF